MQLSDSQHIALPSSLRLLQHGSSSVAPPLHAPPHSGPTFPPPGKGQFGSVRQVTHRFTGGKYAVKSIAKRRLVTQVWGTGLMKRSGRCVQRF